MTGKKAGFGRLNAKEELDLLDATNNRQQVDSVIVLHGQQ